MQFVFTFQMPPENEALQQQLARARCLLFHDKKKINDGYEHTLKRVQTRNKFALATNFTARL